MNLIIIDGENELNKINQNLKNDITEVCLISEIDNIDIEKYEKRFLVSILEKHFLSFNSQRLLMDFKSEIFLVPVVNNDFDSLILLRSWINPLNKYFETKIIQHKIVNYENYLDEFTRYFNYITSGEYDKDIELAKQENFEMSKTKTEPVENNFFKDKDIETVEIYTDGACSGNPGAGGWGAVLIHGEKKKEISGYDPLTTNNKMELFAVIQGLSMLKRKCNVNLYSDSAYVVNAITQNWLENWKNNGWKNSSREQVKNKEMWQELDLLLQTHNVIFHKVKGHADNFYNNRCDELATGEIAKNQ